LSEYNQNVTIQKKIPVYGKGKTAPVLNYAPCHEDIWGSAGIAPCSLNMKPYRRKYQYMVKVKLYPCLIMHHVKKTYGGVQG
jgi:hypothetical protein